MDLGRCLIINVLRRFNFISIDKLANLVFIVDRVGNYNAFSWSRVDLVITSDEFLDTFEGLVRDGVIRVNNGLVSMSGVGNVEDLLNRECGWLRGSVDSTVSFVIREYGPLNDDELSDIVESMFEGVL
ncbi:hypothetical protein [Vulcanisaeta thermophila]|uniref:hypothetical protein n=1 Tax=Vulcanisaeta thermophila TaxID=867917 RepID=UPI000852F464|nr:hypothetical protein [Vulcanisaeta thermophila]